MSSLRSERIPMAAANLECQILERALGGAEGSYTLCNPTMRPGSLVFGLAMSAGTAFGGQLGYRVALKEFLDECLESVVGHNFKLAPMDTSAERDALRAIIAAAFRRSNTRLFDFASRMSARGKALASLLGMVVSGNVVAAGRVGEGAAYLVRGGEIFPFFGGAPLEKDAASRLIGVGCLGIEREVKVELSSVEIEPGDLIFASSFDMATPLFRACASCGLLERTSLPQGAGRVERLLRFIEAQQPDLRLLLALQVGDPIIYLSPAARLPGW